MLIIRILLNFVKYIFFIGFSAVLVLVATSCRNKSQSSKSDISDSTITQKLKQKKKEIKRSDLKFVSDTSVVTHTAVLNTSMGKIKIALFGKDAPNTVENFIGLAKKGYYNGILFHRVAKNFLIQTGDGNTKYNHKKADWGKGGKSIWNEDFNDELDNRTPSWNTGYIKGTVAMANRGSNTNTSQFFICLPEARKLQKKWTIFGKVVEGMEVVKKISDVDIVPGPFEQSDGLPKRPIRLLSVSVTNIVE